MALDENVGWFGSYGLFVVGRIRGALLYRVWILSLFFPFHFKEEEEEDYYLDVILTEWAKKVNLFISFAWSAYACTVPMFTCACT